ncbi:MAG: hypothetical protein JWN61_2268 [Pseudonocardiales bacterium]|nr:hypothetical protein [Jatrophihabitantaceae bacterium]MCW2604133.1 hypothetical protein [Pseudonocardiales bacterium]
MLVWTFPGPTPTPAGSKPAQVAGVRIERTHPNMLRHTFDTTVLDAGVNMRDGVINI